MFHRLQVLGMNDNLRDRVREVGSGAWKRCLNYIVANLFH